MVVIMSKTATRVTWYARRHRRTAALRAIPLVLLAACVVVNVPLACLVHCWHTAHAATMHVTEHSTHAHGHPVIPADTAAVEPTAPMHTPHDTLCDAEPDLLSALTVAVLPCLLMLVVLHFMLAHLQWLAVKPQAILLPPPHPPPRAAPVFCFVHR